MGLKLSDFLPRLRRSKTEYQPDGLKTLPAMLAARFGTIQPEWTDWDIEAAQNEGFNGNTWVFACISKRARSAANVPFQAGKEQDGVFVPFPDSDLQKLLDNPNPDHDFSAIIQRLVMHMDLGGNAYWHKVRAGRGRVPAEVWPLQPEEVGIKRGTDKLIEKYKHGRNETRAEPIDAEDMVHFRYENPADPVFGLPPLRPAGRAVDTDNEAQAWQKVSFQNRGISDIHFKLPEGTTQEQLDHAREQFHKKQEGRDNARKALFSTAEAQTLDKTPAELDFVNSRRDIRVEICSAFDVPPPLVGVYDDATLANIRTARRIFWLEGMIPLLDIIEHKLNHDLAKEFGDGWVIRYDVSNVEALQEDRSDKIKDLKELWGMGVPFNVAAQFLELQIDPIEGGDIGYIPAGLLPVGFGEEEQTDEERSGMTPDEIAEQAYGKPPSGSR